MAEFVLVPGAWLGAWVWDDVARRLAEAGQGVRALTLAGVAEKRDLPASQRIHVAEIVAEVEQNDLRDVVLVGHSYGGIPVGQAAERIGDRLRAVVFVDATLPADGQTFGAAWFDDEAEFAAELAEHDGFWPILPAEAYAGQGLTDEQIAYVVGRSTPHPGATLLEPAELSGALASARVVYVKCLLNGDEAFGAGAKMLQEPSWGRVTMDTGHWPMLSEPQALTEILLGEA